MICGLDRWARFCTGFVLGKGFVLYRQSSRRFKSMAFRILRSSEKVN